MTQATQVSHDVVHHSRRSDGDQIIVSGFKTHGVYVWLVTYAYADRSPQVIECDEGEAHRLYRLWLEGQTSNSNMALPAEVVQLRKAVAEFIGVNPLDLFVADHTHEGLRPGSFSMAHEGGHVEDWPFNYQEAASLGKRFQPSERWVLEAGSNVVLNVYPQR